MKFFAYFNNGCAAALCAALDVYVRTCHSCISQTDRVTTVQNELEPLAFLIELAEDAGMIIRRHARSPATPAIPTTTKPDGTPVTIADQEVSVLVNERMAERCPHIAVICEERPITRRSEIELIVDEIDGTASYCMGVPMCTFMAALSGNGQILSSIVYDPIMGRAYWARRGTGAYMRQDRHKSAWPMKVAERKNMPRIGICSWRNAPQPHLWRVAEDLENSGCDIVPMGSVGYADAMVAAGEYDGVIFPGQRLWDNAAGSLLVQEAGGIVTDLRGRALRFDGDSVDGHIASNGSVHGMLLAAVGKYS